MPLGGVKSKWLHIFAPSHYTLFRFQIKYVALNKCLQVIRYFIGDTWVEYLKYDTYIVQLESVCNIYLANILFMVTQVFEKNNESWHFIWC